MALRFTAACALLAAKRIRIFPMNQHALWPITFGMKGSNELVDGLTALCFTASSVVPAWEFVYDLSAVGNIGSIC
jgi:hypothetical protein